MNRRGRTAVVLAAVLISAYPAPVQAAQGEGDGFWYDGEAPEYLSLDLQRAEEYGAAPWRTGDEPEEGQSAPELLRAGALPRAYMNDVDTLAAAYPAPKMQSSSDCWAFSAVGLAEFDLITDDQVMDRSVDFSELQMAYFTYHYAEDPLEGTYGDQIELQGGSYLSFGGNLDFSVRSLLQWKGLVDESKFPYEDAGKTRSIDSRYAYEDVVAHLQNAFRVNIKKDAAGVKEAVMKHGAVGTGYHASVSTAEDKRFIGSGPYNGREVDTYYCGDAKLAANHAVNIVGWDDDFPAENFAEKPKGDGAWLIRNSWSNEAGFELNSYFWLSYYDATIDKEVWVLDFEPADNYDNNYQYDGSATVLDAYGFDKVANVFTVKADANEVLQAVSFSMMDHTNVPYTVRVYTNLADGNKPLSGSLAATVKGKTGYAGAYTVPLEEGVPLAKGTKFSVVVETQSGKGVDVECGLNYSYGTVRCRTTAYIEPGQSFVYYKKKWQDMEDLRIQYRTGNVCVKAYTSALQGKSVAAVKNVKKSSVGKTSVSLKWSRVSGASGYEVYRASSKNGTYKKVKTIADPEVTSCKDTGLTKNKTYYYRVRAYRDNGGTARTVGKMSGRTAVTTKK